MNVRFGTIAIDPAAGPQTATLVVGQPIICPEAYVCSGFSGVGSIQIDSAPATLNLSMEGSLATLSDGAGHTLTFDPAFNDGTDIKSLYSVGGVGGVTMAIGGSITFTGNEVAGVYNTTNAGGSGYIVNVNY